MANGFAHIELNTDDPGKAEKFYKAVFPSWKFKAMPAMHYTGLSTGTKDGPGGGVQKKPMQEAPTQWLPYVRVDDVKKTVAKARKAGARVVQDYMPIGDMGAIAVFVDPTGAAIGVWEEAKKKAPKKKAKKAAKKAKKAAKKR